MGLLIQTTAAIGELLFVIYYGGMLMLVGAVFHWLVRREYGVEAKSEMKKET